MGYVKHKAQRDLKVKRVLFLQGRSKEAHKKHDGENKTQNSDDTSIKSHKTNLGIQNVTVKEVGTENQR